MRQLWISVGILVVMVALLFWNVVKVDQLTQPMLKELSQATTAARGDDWPVQMHDAIDEVTLLLREAQGYLQDRKTGEYLSALGKLTGKLEAIQEQERVSAENLF